MSILTWSILTWSIQLVQGQFHMSLEQRPPYTPVVDIREERGGVVLGVVCRDSSFSGPVHP